MTETRTRSKVQNIPVPDLEQTAAQSPGRQRRPHSAERLCTATSKEETSFSRRYVSQRKEKTNPHPAETRDLAQFKGVGRSRVQCKREASGIRRTVTPDRSANDLAKQVTMTSTPAVPNEPTDHAVASGRDVSLRYEGGHRQRLGVVLQTTDGPQRQRPLRPVLTVSSANDHEWRNAE